MRAKLTGFLLNLGGNVYSNLNNFLKYHGNILLFDMQVYAKILHLNIKKGFENSNLWARYDYLISKQDKVYNGPRDILFNEN